MYIPGRKKKEGPDKTVLELYLYLQLYRYQSFLPEHFLTRFHVSERTLFRYIKELKTVCSRDDIHRSGKEGRIEFIVQGWTEDGYPLEAPELTCFSEEPHLTRLSRLICLFHLIENEAENFLYPDEDVEPISVSDLAGIIKKAGFPELSHRTLLRDLKEIRKALDFLDEYEETHY